MFLKYNGINIFLFSSVISEPLREYYEKKKEREL